METRARSPLRKAFELVEIPTRKVVGTHPPAGSDDLDRSRGALVPARIANSRTFELVEIPTSVKKKRTAKRELLQCLIALPYGVRDGDDAREVDLVVREVHFHQRLVLLKHGRQREGPRVAHAVVCEGK